MIARAIGASASGRSEDDSASGDTHARASRSWGCGAATS